MNYCDNCKSTKSTKDAKNIIKQCQYCPKRYQYCQLCIQKHNQKQECIQCHETMCQINFDTINQKCYSCKKKNSVKKVKQILGIQSSANPL